MTSIEPRPQTVGDVPARRRVAIILAAGKGTRMRSRHPKPLFEVAGRPMLRWVVDAAREGGCEKILLVVGHGAELVRQEFGEADITFVTQEPQLGTGHAVAVTEEALFGDSKTEDDATLVVLNGDVPGLRAETVNRLASASEEGWGALGVAELDDPGRLGRVLTRCEDPDKLERIVEAADAGPSELAIRLINAGFYAVPARQTFDFLRRLDMDNAQGELYLTDAMGMAAAAGKEVRLVRLQDPKEALGINDRRDLARVHRVLIDRHLDSLMAAGVTILDSASTVIEPTVRIGMDSVIHPGVSLFGHTGIGQECEIHQGCWIRDAQIADGVEILPYCVVEETQIDEDCHVGPFARSRPASVLLKGARVGNFVEIKKTRLGKGAKVGHLTYLGDADIGEGTNVGAGVVTCNYDGVSKHRTEVGKNAFIGSDTMLVAPVRVGDSATTGAGSVVTHDVPAGSLAVGRARQKNIENWAERKKASAKKD